MTRKEKRMVAVLAVILIVLFVTSFVRAARAASMKCTTIEVVVRPGEGIWNLWEKYGHGDYHKWKYDVMQLNSLEAAGLMAYQKIIIPVINEEEIN